MNPIIRHLQEIGFFPAFDEDQNPRNWILPKEHQTLGSDFYSKIIPLHPILNLEYSVLCNQLDHNILSNTGNTDKIKSQVLAALMLAELLEHIYQYYLGVPREVQRLRQHQKVYREILITSGFHNLPSSLFHSDPEAVGFSLSQHIRNNTLNANWYRLFFSRVKRLLSAFVLFESCSESFRSLMSRADDILNPLIGYLAWCFFLPRLVTNLLLLFKHTIPGSWMGEEEQSLGWWTRLHAQLQRRWFELSNDIAWVIVGMLNTFLLTGALTPVGTYLVIVFFAYDVVIASLRAYIELNHIYSLNSEFSMMLEQEDKEENKKEIREYQDHLNQRLYFDMARLGVNIAATSAVFLAMCFVIPAFMIHPVVPLIGAVLLVAISLATFILTRILEHYRPKERVEKLSAVASLGIFANKNQDLGSSSSLSDTVHLNPFKKLE